MTNRWKCLTVSPVKFLFKFTNKIGEITGEWLVKLFHRSLVNRWCGEFLQFPTLAAAHSIPICRRWCDRQTCGRPPNTQTWYMLDASTPINVCMLCPFSWELGPNSRNLQPKLLATLCNKRPYIMLIDWMTRTGKTHALYCTIHFGSYYPVFHPPMGRDFSFKFSGVARDQNVEQIRAENNNKQSGLGQTLFPPLLI